MQSGPTFGRRLAAIRKNRGLTQIELAKAIGKTRTAIGHWEAGRAFIRGSDLAQVASALECRIRDLLAPPGVPIPPLWWPRRTAKRRGHAGSAPPTSDEAAELERLKALLLEVLQRLVRYEPEAVDLLGRITAPPGSVSDARRAA
jgi:transcriptional regulator with XRE-family HTH domain